MNSLSHPRCTYQLESKIYIAKCLEMTVEVIAVVLIGEVEDETEMVEEMEGVEEEEKEVVEGMEGGVEGEEMMTGKGSVFHFLEPGHGQCLVI